MLSRIDPRFLSRQNTTRRSALIVILISSAFLYYLIHINWGDDPLPETEHSKQISARWLVLARESGCDESKIDGPAATSGCNPNRLKPEDYAWIQKQAPGHLQEALQWAMRRDHIVHGQQ